MDEEEHNKRKRVQKQAQAKRREDEVLKRRAKEEEEKAVKRLKTEHMSESDNETMQEVQGEPDNTGRPPQQAAAGEKLEVRKTCPRCVRMMDMRYYAVYAGTVATVTCTNEECGAFSSSLPCWSRTRSPSTDENPNHAHSTASPPCRQDVQDPSAESENVVPWLELRQTAVNERAHGGGPSGAHQAGLPQCLG